MHLVRDHSDTLALTGPCHRAPAGPICSVWGFRPMLCENGQYKQIKRSNDVCEALAEVSSSPMAVYHPSLTCSLICHMLVQDPDNPDLASPAQPAHSPAGGAYCIGCGGYMAWGQEMQGLFQNSASVLDAPNWHVRQHQFKNTSKHDI